MRQSKLPIQRTAVRLLLSPAPVAIASVMPLVTGIGEDSAMEWLVESVNDLWDIGATDQTHQSACQRVLEEVERNEFVVVVTHRPIRTQLVRAIARSLQINVHDPETTNAVQSTYPVLFNITRRTIQPLAAGL